MELTDEWTWINDPIDGKLRFCVRVINTFLTAALRFRYYQVSTIIATENTSF